MHLEFIRLIVLFFCLVQIYVSRKNEKSWQLFISMEQYSGSQCQFLSQHVKLIFGKFSKKEKRNQVVVSLQSVSVRYTKMSHEIWLVDIRSIESRPTILS